MGWPEWILMTLCVIDLLFHVSKNGELREYNATYKVIDLVIMLLLLQWGGFFS